MKNITYTIGLIAILVCLGCDQGIDPITRVAPEADQAPPAVTIKYPAEGLKIKVKEDVIPITIEFKVEDDIEIASIVVKMDGNIIETYSNFKDYRKVVIEDLVYPNLGNGNHTFTVTSTDKESKETSQTVNFIKEEAYKPVYDGEIFYMPFDGDYSELISVTKATEVGSPGFAGKGVVGPNAFSGAADSYLTFPTKGLLENEFSATFWYKVNADPNRAGILVIGPPDEENPENQNNRDKGFRFFRENAGGNQRFKLNVGTGKSDVWVDGGQAASIAPGTDWVQMAFTLSPTKAIVYIDGEPVKEVDISGVDWTGCDILSIGSGAPRFTGWNHLSDQSFIDELRFYNKALTQEEIQEIKNADL